MTTAVRYTLDMLEHAFDGFIAIASPDWKKPWREVFGVKADWQGDITKLYLGESPQSPSGCWRRRHADGRIERRLCRSEARAWRIILTRRHIAVMQSGGKPWEMSVLRVTEFCG
jgi:hypothetical protein